MNYKDIITIEPDKRSGKPCIRGTRMTVQDVLEYLSGGMSEAELPAEFPDNNNKSVKIRFIHVIGVPFFAAF